MNFFRLTKEQYRNYLSSVRRLMKESGFTREGVAFAATDDLSQRTQTHFCAGEVSDAEEELFRRAYVDIEKTYLQRYEMFFERCVGDPSLHAPLDFQLSSVKEYVQSFVAVSDETMQETYDTTAEGTHADNMKIFAALFDNDFLNVAEETENARVSAYR